jgi:SNF2 family DNA or RNA helicase
MIRTKAFGQHQTDVLEFCTLKEETQEYAGIFADYGTGKTWCALALTEVKKFRKVLVVATKLAIDTTWCDEVRMHTDFRFCILRGTAKQKANLLTYALGQIDDPTRFGYSVSHKPMLFMINYDGVKSIYYELIRAEFDAVFVDESTKIKTFDAARTIALYEVGGYIKHRYIMTGFPVTEHLAELYSQIKFLDRGKTFGNSYYAFLNRYFVRMGMKMVVKKKAITQILGLIAPFCIRVTNKSLKLPPKIYKKISLELTEDQSKLMKDLNDTFKLEFGEVKIDTKYIFTLIAKSLQICDGFVQNVEYEYIEKNGKRIRTNKIISETLEVIDTNKDEALIEVLDQIDVAKNKVVIWSAFLFSVEKIKRILTKLHIPVLTLIGGNVDDNRTVQWFQKSRDHNVLICTQKKAAESVTLTSSRYGIYYSNIWSNDARQNSEARIRRKGSNIHSNITYIDLVTKCKVEESVYSCLRVTKKNLIDQLKQEFLSMRKE